MVTMTIFSKTDSMDFRIANECVCVCVFECKKENERKKRKTSDCGESYST